MKRPIRTLFAAAILCSAVAAQAADWTIPAGGNAFRTAPEPGRNGFQRNRAIALGDPDGVFSIYFHLDRGADLRLALQGRVSDGRSTVLVRVGGKEFTTAIMAFIDIVLTIKMLSPFNPGIQNIFNFETETETFCKFPGGCKIEQMGS